DLVEHVRRYRGRAAGADLGGDRLGDLDVEVGRFEGELRFLRLDQHVGENWNGIAPLDHAMDMAERLQERCAFDGDLHFSIRPLAWTSPKGGKEGGACLRFSQGRWRLTVQLPNGFGRISVPPGRRENGKKLAGKATHQGESAFPPCSQPLWLCQLSGTPPAPTGLAHSCNCRFSSSISSASAVSVLTRFSILRTACSTVVWSRPPNRRPISGSERSVSVLARYMATWRGRTTFAVRRDDNRSARLTLYCRATTR